MGHLQRQLTVLHSLGQLQILCTMVFVTIDVVTVSLIRSMKEINGIMITTPRTLTASEMIVMIKRHREEEKYMLTCRTFNKLWS